MYAWRKGIASWKIKGTLYLSIPFTWLLPEARNIASKHSGTVRCGGPAVSLLPDFLPKKWIATESLPYSPLTFHNPLATFTSRGCDNSCGFCAVPKIEGKLVELKDWPIRPIICDNNLLGTSKKHFDSVIDKLKSLPFVDFNQGLEADLFTVEKARKISELKQPMIRFAFDHISEESNVVDAITLAKSVGLKNIGCYVLVGFNDTPEDAKYRLDLLIEKGVRPNPMRFQPLDSLKKDSFLSKNWDAHSMARVIKYYSKLNFLGHIPFEDYVHNNSDIPGGFGLL